MRMVAFIVSYSMLVALMLPEDVVADYRAELWFPSQDTRQCVIGDEDCSVDIQRLQSHMARTLNEKRAHIANGLNFPAPKATNMLILEDDEILKDKAQKYAVDCVQKYGSPELCPPPDNVDLEGDVSVSVSKYNKTETRFSAAARFSNLVQKWSRLPQNPLEFVKNFSHSQDKGKFLDLAKIVHARVWKVGCGLADFFSTEEEYYELNVCFYGGPKLRDGEELYKTDGEPCQQCPSGTECNKEMFEGYLCKVTDVNSFTLENHLRKRATAPVNAGSEDGRNGDLIWNCDLQNYNEGCIVERSCAPRWTVDATGWNNCAVTFNF